MRHESISSLGAVLASILASVCCIGPVILAGLGIGSLGFAAVLAPYRLYFLALTALLLGFAFWRTYRKPSGQAEECCETSPEVRSKVDRFRKRLLWVVTGFAILAAGFPTLQAYFLGSDSSAGIVWSEASVPVLLEVEGMTCPGCAHNVESALSKVPGVEGSEVRYETGEAIIYTGDPVPTAAALVEAVEQAGYRARPKKRN